jgi:hypothetical protein
MDVLWLRVSKRSEAVGGVMGRFGSGALPIELDRGEQWQLGYVIRKGSFKQLQAAGIAALRQSIATLAPELADRVTAEGLEGCRAAVCRLGSAAALVQARPAADLTLLAEPAFGS